MTRTVALPLALLLLVAATPPRDILVSANDGKPVRPGDTAAATVPDTLTVLDATRAGVRRLGEVAIDASMTGPPESVKLSRDGRYTILTAAQRRNPGGTPPLIPGDALSVVDLADPAHPRVVQRLAAGAGAAGVAIASGGRLGLVANGAADTVSAFAFARGRLSPLGTVALPKGARPVSIRFARDGRTAIVAAAGAGRVHRLAIDGTGVVATGAGLATGRVPFGMSVSADGRIAFVANVEGDAAGPGGPAAIGTVSAIDLPGFRLLATAPLGNLPEGIAVSPSGRYLQATLVNGSQLPPGTPGRNPTGLLRVFRLAGAAVTPLAEIATPPLCQGAAWTRDERCIVLQCAGSRTLETYRFDGRSLTREAAPPIVIGARPGAIAGTGTR